MKMIIFGIGFVGMFVLMLALSFFIGGTVLWAGWNYGVAAVFNVPPLSYWPACFIGLLFGMLRSSVSTKSA